MKSILKYIFLTLGILIVLGYIVFTLWHFSGNNKEIVCRELEIILSDNDKIKLISQRDVALILEESNLNPMGKTLKHIRTESIEDILQNNPMVKTAECFKTPSGIVQIRIQQRCPKFRVVGMSSYYIDTDRKTLPISSNYAAYVPIVSGRVTVSMSTGELFDFVTFLEENPFWNAQIEQIYIRDDLKIELVPRVGDAIVILGTLDNYRAKLEKLHKLYLYGFNEFGWNRYKTIDLQYKNQVVCTKVGTQDIPPKMVVNELKDSIISSKL
ncbi:MAG: cell division protein FtsQ [Paludibacter sp.]|nr:cell division protein FtsQ [Paludibacter sp.]